MPGETAPIHHDVIERQRVIDRPAVPDNARFQQGPLFALKTAGEHLRHELLHFGQRDVRDETEPPVIDADQRRAIRRKLPPNAEHGAVAAEHDRHVRARANFRRGQRGVVGHADVMRRFRFEHDVEAAFQNARGERRQRLPDAGRIVAPHERDSLELGTNFHAGITP
jgi:hypothetical protein